ncbi:MAG: Xaa-Pro peptidase family protein [Clostridia bacterium]
MQNFVKKIEKADAVLVTSDINRRYFTGFNSSAGMVLITSEQSYFLTDFRYITAAKSGISNCEVMMVERNRGYNVILTELFAKYDIKTLGIEYQTTTISDFENLKANFDVEFCDVSREIQNLRNAKTEDESQKMRDAQKIADETFTEIVEFIRENYKKGLTEKIIGAKLVALMYEKGADGLSFQPIVASGVNGASPHARPTHKKIVEGEFITMDFGCVLNGYCSDMTRTICVGQPTEEMVKIYNLVLEAQRLGIEFAKAGVKGSEIHAKAHDFFEKHDMAQYFGHGFGHGIGMECHEGLSASPACEVNLPENFFVSAEPGLYIDGFCGVRIEDILRLTKEGNEDITKAPKNLIII